MNEVIGHEWIVDHQAPPRSFDPEGVHCTKCGIKGLRWVGFYTVAVDDVTNALTSRAWEHWKRSPKWVSHICYGPPRPRLPMATLPGVG
jgi:hypothetical protein